MKQHTVRNKWVREIMKEAEHQGFRVIITTNHHILFRAPDGVRTAMASQNQSPRHAKNILADLKRLGFQPKDE